MPDDSVLPLGSFSGGSSQRPSYAKPSLVYVREEEAPVK